MGFIDVLVLIALIKLLLASHSPKLCAGLYTITAVIINLSVNTSFDVVNFFIIAVIAFIFSYIYFWLLDRFEGSGWWWAILVGGIILGAII